MFVIRNKKLYIITIFEEGKEDSDKLEFICTSFKKAKHAILNHKSGYCPGNHCVCFHINEVIANTNIKHKIAIEITP